MSNGDGKQLQIWIIGWVSCREGPAIGGVIGGRTAAVTRINNGYNVGNQDLGVTGTAVFDKPCRQQDADCALRHSSYSGFHGSQRAGFEELLSKGYLNHNDHTHVGTMAGRSWRALNC